MNYLFYSLGMLLSFAFAAPAAADGFFDVFGGNAMLSSPNVTESAYEVNTKSQYDYSAKNVGIPNSATGGFRVGSIHKYDHFSLGGAFVLEDYSAMANYPYPTASAFSSELKNQQGGNILQPGVDMIVGIPLRFFRLYGGAGLTMPIMSYGYTSYDQTSNTIDPNATGTSMALGYNLFAGVRWLISNRFNIFLEDRFSSLFTPMVIKNSFYDPTYGFYNSSFTFNTLAANRIVMGLGFAW